MWQLITLILSMVILATTGCGWHLYSTIPSQMKKIIFDSVDQNNLLNRAIRRQLYLDNFILFDKSSQNITSLRILHSSLSKDTASIFKDGRTAEYRMILSINAAILIPGEDVYIFSTKVYRYFFDNHQTALAKYAEQQIIISEMYGEAAKKIIRKLINIQRISKFAGIKHAVPLIIPNISTIQGK